MPSKRSRKTHEDYLKLVCFFCLKKSVNRGRSRYLSSSQKKNIKSQIFPPFDEKIMPTGCCNTCNAILGDKYRSVPTQDYHNTYQRLLALPPLTRTNPICDCFICQIAKENCIKSESIKSPEPKKEYKLCENCHAQKIPGKHRVCNRSERVKNLMENITPRTRMQLALETTIEEKAKKSSDSPLRVSRISGGPPLAITVAGKNDEKQNES